MGDATMQLNPMFGYDKRLSSIPLLTTHGIQARVQQSDALRHHTQRYACLLALYPRQERHLAGGLWQHLLFTNARSLRDPLGRNQGA